MKYMTRSKNWNTRCYNRFDEPDKIFIQDKDIDLTINITNLKYESEILGIDQYELVDDRIDALHWDVINGFWFDRLEPDHELFDKNQEQEIEQVIAGFRIETCELIDSGAPRAKRASGAPWENKSSHRRKFGNHVTDRPTDRPHHRHTNVYSHTF